MGKGLAVGCMLLSVAALLLAGYGLLHAKQIASDAVHAREQELIRNVWVDVRTIYSNLGVEPEPEERPQTIEELLEPMFRPVRVEGK